jgi:hypothetical protein
LIEVPGDMITVQLGAAAAEEAGSMHDSNNRHKKAQVALKWRSCGFGLQNFFPSINSTFEQQMRRVV